MATAIADYTDLAVASPAITSDLSFNRSSGARLGGRAASLDDLVQFRQWSVFLPRAICAACENNTVYVRSRHAGNPQLFEQCRDRLSLILHDMRLLGTRGLDIGTGAFSVVAALETVLKAQWTALGFLSNRQFHKALSLGVICTELVDALASLSSGASSSQAAQQAGSVEGRAGGFLVFWRLLCRANLGGAYAKFGKYDEARSVLKQGLEIAETAEGVDARERVLVGACYSHLFRIDLAAGSLGEALRLADLEVEVFERFIWDLSDTREDREAEALVLATSYINRGICDVRLKKYDSALMWFGRAQECLEKRAGVGEDFDQFTELISNHIEHARTLQL